MGTNIAQYLMGIMVILVAGGSFILLLSYEVPLGIKDSLLVAFGMFITKFGTVVDYFFGSSESSKRKSERLKEFK